MSKKRWLLVVGVMMSGVFLIAISIKAEMKSVSATVGFAKLSPALWEDLAEGGETTFLVLLTEQADLTHVTTLSGKAAKGRAVYDALRTVAQRTQAPLRTWLDAHGAEYRSFYIVNMLAVRGDAALALALTKRPDVARLAANPSVRADLPIHEPSTAATPSAVASIPWGVAQINADDVWALGVTGQGIIVAGQDTGYDWDHPALVDQYRGWNGATVIHDYNWHDAIHSGGGSCGADSPEPCDDYGHGTHTLGTMIGDDGLGSQIGVAPGAQWIGCRNMNVGVGTPATYAECFEFFLAPYPLGGDPFTDGDPTKAPHVINNSWSCPVSEGCDVDSLRDVVENTRAAGIVVVVSAGNSGSACSTVNTPPALHDASFTVGATDVSDQIASFSSRGPVTVDGSGRPKPDVAAPGVNVWSSVPDGGYGYKNGTSMAAPHVSGLVALLWSAWPHLIGNVDLTERIIQETARPWVNTACGGDADGHPNNVYGWGIVDALAAVRYIGLHVSASAEPTWVAAGGVVTYTFAVTNTGVLSPATGVVLSDSLPVSTTFAWASDGPTGDGQDVIWSLGALSPGQSISAALAVTIESGVVSGTLISNTDYQVRSNELPETVSGSPVVVTVFQVGDPVTLSVSADVTPGWVQPGGLLTYTFTVSHTGLAPATGVVLSDTLPTSTTYAWSAGTLWLGGEQVVWDLGTLYPDAALSVTLVVTVAPGLPPGAAIVNTDYAVRSNEAFAPVTGPPVVALVPWQVFLPVLIKP
jgi:uncharacterized repeat protein (TIGR01451 family)